MKITGVRILPPIAIARLGSSKSPLDAFDLEEPSEGSPADYRRIVPRETFNVSDDGKLTKFTPDKIQFKDAEGKIRPVAPFLQVFAITDEDELVPLTDKLLKEANLKFEDISWSVTVGNHKAFRRTGAIEDKIDAVVPAFRDHEIHLLIGKCDNFIAGKTLPLGSVQFIRSTADIPGIRLRFTPAEGKVYGSSKTRFPSREKPTEGAPDPIINDDSLVLYDTEKAKVNARKANGLPPNAPVRCWSDFVQGDDPPSTSPGNIYAGAFNSTDDYQSWGYFDDECDGIVTFTLKTGEQSLITRAIIVAGPPAFAPDSLPVRVVSDEIEQILLGPEANDLEIEDALQQSQEVVRRSLDTVRLMNTTVANNGPTSMVTRDRRRAAIMAPSLVDNRAVVALHEQVLTALASGTPPWFAEVLRRPEEVADLTDSGRRKMPALMRNADGFHLALTYRLINTIVFAETQGMFRPPESSSSSTPVFSPGNLAAQLHHQGDGNPVSVLAKSAISNCFPGLEFDFRNFWRHAFLEIELLENDNLVVGPIDSPLKGCRLLRVDVQKLDGKQIDLNTIVLSSIDFSKVDGKDVAIQVTGPGVDPRRKTNLEWSNLLANVMRKPGQPMICIFTKAPSPDQVLFGQQGVAMIAQILTVRKTFDEQSAAVAEHAVEPGELTQGLCAPWQNDYRECACFYWAASRPDYVNVENWSDGLSRGDNWLARDRTGSYIVDVDRTDPRLVTYDELFENWEKHLKFIIRGRDADSSP